MIDKPLATLRLIPRVIWRTVLKAYHDSIIGQSAQAAFWQTLSLPPLLLGLLGLTGYVGAIFGPDTLDIVHEKILAFGHTVFSQSVVDEILAPTVDDVLRRGRGDLVSVGFVISLWAGSSAMSSFVDSIVKAHDQHSLRSGVRQRFFALGLYVEFLALAVLTLPLVALGPSIIARHIPASWHPASTHIFDIAYFPAVILLLVGGLATLYRVALPKPLPWHRLLVGAALAGLIFIVASGVLRVYLGWVTTRGYSYGALATPIAFLLFTYFLGFAVMAGAEFNAAVQKQWPAKETHVEQWRGWITDQFSAAGIDTPGKAAEQLKRIATGPISRPTRRPRPDEEDETAAPPPKPIARTGDVGPARTGDVDESVRARHGAPPRHRGPG
ncbi:YihY/virulence factor BrkB family protein [Tsukamurella sp. 8F]|uniref:YihY/virulence factor BrkB family protein n=1 Tax=unclassified Tsukamurella TaxID=2633480 RepID=UPI0023B990E0|nr:MULTISPECIES: YihY/virulence factor BrkB family protein [unclassified Tsukamurella]MDF0532426.1 YihY/virulence factor BrkB family protein [Tsukamurella sp. 8J]MDF0585192.1 YihY/virulence factor BrkB family protein [Tsukamurella sp. 8F]